MSWVAFRRLGRPAAHHTFHTILTDRHTGPSDRDVTGPVRIQPVRPYLELRPCTLIKISLDTSHSCTTKFMKPLYRKNPNSIQSNRPTQRNLIDLVRPQIIRICIGCSTLHPVLILIIWDGSIKDEDLEEFDMSKSRHVEESCIFAQPRAHARARARARKM